MPNDDLTYHRRRAEDERKLARRASRPEAMAAHLELAQAYGERVAAVEPLARTPHA